MSVMSKKLTFGVDTRVADPKLETQTRNFTAALTISTSPERLALSHSLVYQ
jgi:hypothetical protein